MRKIALISLLFILVFFAASTMVIASDSKGKPVLVDFKDVELPVFIRFVAELTGKNIVFDDKVTGKVSVYSHRKITPEELWQIFLSVLSFKGYAVIQGLHVVQIIPSAMAKQTGGQIVTEKAVELKERESFLTRIIHLTHLNAAEAVKILTPLISKEGVVNFYLPTNTIVITDTFSNVERLFTLLRELDKEIPPGKRRVHVYYLENAEADDVAKTLNALFARRPPPPGPPPPKTPAEMEGIFVTADKPTNSLIITAAPEDYETIKSVIKKLDIRRRQVFVEAAIMEITLTKMRELGFEFRSMERTTGRVTPFGGTEFGGMGRAITGPETLATLSGLVAGVVKGTFTFRGTEYMNVGALVRALQAEGDINVLSTPHLLTTDNQKAEIVIGQNVPFITGQSQSPGGVVLTTVERKDVGITLRLVPRITEGDYVKLEIYQEISALTTTPELNPNVVGPSITKRYANTTVVVKDGETVAIGGLLKDDEQLTIKRVPLLGDIPILGYIFRYERATREKTNLLIFLTPKVVREAADIEAITKEKKEEAERFREKEIEKEIEKDR
ncbi:MAG: secretin N-terminal domain-containing protein [Nitrospirota bacterium]